MSTRPTRWARGTGEGTVLSNTFAFVSTPVIAADNETLLRVRWRYVLVGESPGGTLVAQWHPGVHGVMIDDHSFTIAPDAGNGPLLSPLTSDGQPWLWWEGFAYDHWSPTSSDPRWVAPQDHQALDTKAERKLNFSTFSHTYALCFMWQIPDAIDWIIVATYLSWSALIMEAPA